MKRKTLEVETQFGTLCAEVGGDPDYPEIFIYLRNKDGVEIDLCVVGTERGGDELNAYLYPDTATDDWKNKHSWTREELNVREEL